MPKTSFKKSLLASSIALLAGAPAFAQDTAEEELIVTGVRGSQQSAISIKRNANSIVDGIAAEDIGKLPDVTIVDSLQRITGIQIQRSGGEGVIANIRGFDRVSTLLNGEAYLTARNLTGGAPNLSDVPSQLMSGVDVYKSQNFRNANSGITGTIDLKTRRPSSFDEGVTSSFAVEVAQGQDNGEVDPAFNGLLNWRNDSFGAMVAVAHSDSTLLNNSNGWTAGGPNGTDNQWAGGSPELAEGFSKISGHGFDMISQETLRERDGVNISLETDLGEGFTLITEGFYTKMTELNRAVGLNISNRWSNPGNMRSDVYNDTGVEAPNGNNWVNTDRYEMDALWINSFGRGTTLKSQARNYNLQLDYDNGGNFTAQARITKSFGEVDQTGGQTQADLSNWVGSQNVRHATFYPEEVAATFPESRYRDDLGVGVDGGRFIDPSPFGYGEDPVLTVDTSDDILAWGGPGLTQGISGGLGAGNTLADYMSNLGSYHVSNTTSEGNFSASVVLDTSSIKGNYKFDEPLLGFITSVDAGVRNEASFADVDAYHIFAPVYAGHPNVSDTPCSVQWRATDVQLNNNSGVNCSAGELIILPDGVEPGDNVGYPADGGGVQTGIVVGTADNAGQVYGQTVLAEGDVWASYRPGVVQGIDAINNVVWVDDFGDGATGLPGFWAADPKDFDDPLDFHRRTFGDVDVVSVPGQTFDIDIETFQYDVVFNFEAGDFSGNFGGRHIDTEILTRANVTAPNALPYTNTNPDVGDQVDRNTYSDFLPAVNVAYTPTDSWTFRFAASKTMMRNNLGQYGGGLSISTAVCSEPALNEAGTRCVTGANSGGNAYLDPWRATNLDLSAEYYFGDASAFSVGYYKIDLESFVVGETVLAEFPDGDGVVRREVNFSRPALGDGGTVEGIEVAAKLAFSDLTDASFITNLGVDTNYTFSPSESEGTENASGDAYPLNDNSKNLFNFALWYQNDKFQARVAYNYRDKRFEGGTLGNLERYQKATSYIDANVTYSITDQIDVYLNGSNLTDENEIYVIDFTNGQDEQFRTRNQNEARLSLGVRATF